MSRAPADAAGRIRSVRNNLARVIVGKEEMLDLTLLAIIAGGHVLVEDIPGVGKTTLARAVARSVQGTFRRIQFTPDLLPSDITGANVFRPDEGTFTFRPGPLFAHILLADEINRASPRTQSALLEAMSEEQVTVDGVSYRLPAPFVVLATQNPVEYHGTYPLPEAQLDRFMLRLAMGYPPEAEEMKLLVGRTSQDPVQQLEPAIALQELEELRAAVDAVTVEESVAAYMFDIVRATRRHPSLQLGVSPRGALLYARAARARALSKGRGYVLPEDAKTLAVPALAHRVLLDTKAKYEGAGRDAVIAGILEETRVPR